MFARFAEGRCFVRLTRKKPRPPDSARSYAVYSDAVVGAILLLKFEQIEPLGAWFAERLAEVVSAEIVGGCGGFRYHSIAYENASEGRTRQRWS